MIGWSTGKKKTNLAFQKTPTCKQSNQVKPLSNLEHMNMKHNYCVKELIKMPKRYGGQYRMSVLFLIQENKSTRSSQFTIYSFLQLKKETPDNRKRTEKCSKRQNRGTGLSESPEWALFAPMTVVGGVEQKGKNIWIRNLKKKEKNANNNINKEK